MTKDKDFKRLVRARMAEAGERYTEARQRLEKDTSEGRCWPGALVVGDAMGKAHALGHHWAGEEHLLLVVLEAPPESVARRAFAATGITYESAAAALDAHVARVGPPTPRRYSGTLSDASYHSVLGRAEGLALGLGSVAVGPEHVLLALLWQVEGIFAELLSELGASREALFLALYKLGMGLGIRPPSTPIPNPLLSLARLQAGRLGLSFIGQEHVVMALLTGEPDTLAKRALQHFGITYDSWDEGVMKDIEEHRTLGSAALVVEPICTAARQLLVRLLSARAPERGPGPARGRCPESRTLTRRLGAVGSTAHAPAVSSAGRSHGRPTGRTSARGVSAEWAHPLREPGPRLEPEAGGWQGSVVRRQRLPWWHGEGVTTLQEKLSTNPASEHGWSRQRVWT